MLELIGQTLAYAGVGIGILAAGYFVLDALTPGHLGQQVVEKGNMNAGVLLASALVSLGLVEYFAIHFTGAGWDGLDDAAVFGGVGLGLQALGFVLLDALTPGKLGDICMSERFHPAVLVSSAVQIGVALIVCASLT
jgi:uncharacterized membrane protein YjfL (UPF0719 family)